MGWVNPWLGQPMGWIGLGWVWPVWVRIFHFVLGCVGSSLKIEVFYSYVTGLFITYFLTVIPNKRNRIHRLKMAQCITQIIKTKTGFSFSSL